MEAAPKDPDGPVTPAPQVQRFVEPPHAENDTALPGLRAARFDLLSGHLTDPLAVIAPDGLAFYESATSLRLFGPPPLDGPRNVLDLLHADDRPRAQKALKRAAHSTLGANTQLEVRVRRADGAVRKVVLKATNHLADESIAGLVVSFRDLTSEEERQRHLAQTLKMEAVGQLAGGVAHDFNNLLAVILNFTTFVIDELPEGDPKRDDLSEVLKATARGTRLTRELLAFARKDVRSPGMYDLAQAIGDMEALLRRTVGDDIAIELAAPDESLEVEIDEARFEQLVVNLALNARDAMPRGGRLRVTVTSETRGNEEVVRLSFADDGCGIPDDIRARVFEPFFTTKRPGVSTGLGLATVYAVVDKAGGSVYLESEPGRGTTVHLLFPRRHTSFAPEPRPASTASMAVEKRVGAVLVVDDEAAMLAGVVRMLEDEGYVVRSASSGEEALALMTTDGDGVSAVVTDVLMPGMSGVALVEALRAKRPELAVLLMSGHVANVSETQRVMAKGIELLEKPFTRATLVAKLERALVSPRTVFPPHERDQERGSDEPEPDVTAPTDLLLDRK